MAVHPQLGPGQRYCHICGSTIAQARDTEGHMPWLLYECQTCGTYRLRERAAQQLYERTGTAGVPEGRPRLLPNHHLLSATIRARADLTGQVVLVTSLEDLLEEARPLPDGYLGAVDRVLMYVADRLPHLGGSVTLYDAFDYPIAYVQHGTEFAAVMELGYELGFLTYQRAGDAFTVRVSPKGWERLQTLRSARVERRQAFVAMWFREEMLPAYLRGIAPALRVTGYEPLRIDRVEHNDKIDDQIVAAIRRSGLLVADFTGHRGGVYFEAGFAMGLGIPVVWTCREDAIEGAHFDTRQYNHITWSTPEELCTKLRARIEATLPTYPPTPEPAHP